MKVLLINGSSRKNGCTYTALNEVAKSLEEEGIETEIITVGNQPLPDCIACARCRNAEFVSQNGHKCAAFDDIVNEVLEKCKTADGFIFGSPVYYAHPSGRLTTFMDRLFYAGSAYLQHKPAAAVVSARRAGTTASLDMILKYFPISNMPIVPSNYWAMVHGNKPEEVLQDKEGLQIMQVLGKNMAWMLKSFEVAKKNGIEPQKIEKIKTNFIR